MIFQNFWTSLETPIHRAYFVIALAAALLSFLVCALLIKKYLNKKTSLKLKAAGAIFLFGIAVILDPIYLALRAYANYDRVGLQSNISFGIMGYANIVLLVFLREVFYKSEYNWKVYLLIVAEASILPVALALYYAKIDTIYILVVHLLASFVIYLSQYLQSRNLAQKIKNQESDKSFGYKGIQYIGYSGILLFLTYVSFIMQELSGLGLNTFYERIGILQEGATIFIPIGFFLAGISGYVLYIGLILPDWVKKIWKK